MKRLKWVAGTSFILVLVGLVWFLVSGPVLFRLKLRPITHSTSTSVFNPLRDRRPERSARYFLKLIRSQDCTDAIGTWTKDTRAVQTICRKEAEDPLSEGCFLFDRQDTGSEVWLAFRCSYIRPTDSRALVSVTLEKEGNSYRLRDYQRVY
jgi:hypothetical protein